MKREWRCQVTLQPRELKLDERSVTRTNYYESSFNYSITKIKNLFAHRATVCAQWYILLQVYCVTARKTCSRRYVWTFRILPVIYYRYRRKAARVNIRMSLNKLVIRELIRSRERKKVIRLTNLDGNTSRRLIAISYKTNNTERRKIKAPLYNRSIHLSLHYKNYTQWNAVSLTGFERLDLYLKVYLCLFGVHDADDGLYR